MSWPITPMARLYVRGYAERNMTAKVRITRPADAVLDDESGDLSAVTGSVVYVGKARVYPASGPVTYNLGEEVQYFQSSNVSIPLYVGDAPIRPQVDDIVEILEHSDPLTVGKVFRVLDVESGGQLQAARRLQVVGVQRFKSWTPTDRQATPDSRDSRQIPPEWVIE